MIQQSTQGIEVSLIFLRLGAYETKISSANTTYKLFS